VQVTGAETLPSIRFGLVVSVTATGAPLIRRCRTSPTSAVGPYPWLGRTLLAHEVELLMTSDATEDVQALARVAACGHNRPYRCVVNCGRSTVLSDQ